MFLIARRLVIIKNKSNGKSKLLFVIPGELLLETFHYCHKLKGELVAGGGCCWRVGVAVAGVASQGAEALYIVGKVGKQHYDTHQEHAPKVHWIKTTMSQLQSAWQI